MPCHISESFKRLEKSDTKIPLPGGVFIAFYTFSNRSVFVVPGGVVPGRDVPQAGFFPGGFVSNVLLVFQRFYVPICFKNDSEIVNVRNPLHFVELTNLDFALIELKFHNLPKITKSMEFLVVTNNFATGKFFAVDFLALEDICEFLFCFCWINVFRNTSK